MKQKSLFILIVSTFLLVSGCSYYNSYAPDWAKIGSEETKS